MKKSVYSIVLSDNVVKAIDDMAYRMGTSRSNLINQILAQQVSYKTPESEIKDIFDCMKSIMDANFQIQSQSSDAMLSIRSPLRYKYRPTIRYKVELLKEVGENGEFGFLTVSFRTQSKELIDAFRGFFFVWCQVEKQYLDKDFKGGVEYICSDGKVIRKLKLNGRTANNPDSVGKAISDYINLLDSTMKSYFAIIDDPFTSTVKMEKMLLDGIDENIINI